MQPAKVDISVVVAMWNAEDTIIEAISSICDQDLNGIITEVIVVDDCSTDESLRICENQKFPLPLRVIALAKNNGQADARNIGISSATGRYIMILDADDVIIEGALLQIYAEIDENPDVSLVFGGRIEFGPWGFSQKKKYLSLTHLKLAQEISSGKNPITHSGAMFRKEWFNEVGGYLASSKHAEDLSLWFRGLSQGKYLQLDIPTVYYRQTRRVRGFRYWNQMEYARRRAVEIEVSDSNVFGVDLIKYVKYWMHMQFRQYARRN